MDNNQKYLKNYLDSKTKNLSCVESYLNAKKKGDYFYYLENMVNLLIEVEDVIDSLEIQNFFINDFFNMLYFYNKSLDFSEILKKYNYEKIFKNEYKKYIDLIYNDENIEDYHFIEFLINYNLILEKDEKKVCNYFLKKALTKSLEITFESFKNIIIMFVKNKLSFVDNKDISIKNVNRTEKYKVIINEKEVEGLYKNSEYKVLLSIFKMLNKVRMYYLIKEKITDINNLDVGTKDYILSKYLPNYYNDNKTLVVNELDDNAYSIYELINLLKGYKIDFDIDNPYENTINEYKKKLKNTKRIYNNKEYEIDDIYRKFISRHKNILDIVKETL